MSQPEQKTGTIALKDDHNIYTDTNRPDVTRERYFRCTVATHPNEGSWIYVNDGIHTALNFHRDQEVILPEWAIEGLRNTKIRQMVARFAPFQKTVPYFPQITRRYIPEVIEEVSYKDFVAFRDADALKPLPGANDQGANNVQ
jgi:hypothetical protein